MIYKFETLMLGGLTALMILTNGQLSKVFGNSLSNVIIHSVGLIGCLIWLFTKKRSQVHIFSLKNIALFELTGGLIGFLTVWFTNASFLGLGVAATLALAIAGQTLFATLLDATGYLNVTQRPIRPLEMVSIFLTLFGAVLIALGGSL